MKLQVCVVLSVFALVSASSVKPEFWKGTSLDSTIEKMKSSCAEDDHLACFQYRAFSFLDSILQKDYLQISNNVEVTRNYVNDVPRGSDESIETIIEDFIKSHNVKFQLPIVGSVTIDARNIDNEEFDLKLDFNSGRAVEARKKSKLKKILIPILVFILLKAITLVPFALGVLGLKAWNGLQLAFFSFIISAGLAIFQLCQKLAADSAHTHISPATGPWDAIAANHYAARSSDDAQQLAFSAYQ